MPLAAIFINRVHKTALQPEHVRMLEKCISAKRNTKDAKVLAEVCDRAREEIGWADINEFYRRKLAQGTDLPFVEVPFLFTEEFGAAECQSIAALIEDALATTSGRQRGRA